MIQNQKEKSREASRPTGIVCTDPEYSIIHTGLKLGNQVAETCSYVMNSRKKFGIAFQFPH